MANKMDSNKTINGTFGKVWLDGELLAECISFEAKITIEYDDIDIAGDLAKHKKQIGWTGEGTMTLKKVDSIIAKKMQDGVKTGKLPEMVLVAKLEDPASDGAERVEFTGITINEVIALKFEQKTVREEEVPFNFSGYRFIDLI